MEAAGAATPEKGDGAALEALEEHIDGLSSVRTFARRGEAAELVKAKAATTHARG